MSASWDKSVKIWSLESENPIYTFKGYKRFVLCVAISQDGKRIASGDYAKLIKIYRFKSKK